MQDLKTALGQCFWIGLNGTDARDKDTKAIFRAFQPGGTILFQRNVASIPQVTRFNAELQGLSGIPLFTAIDQEGGSVERLHEIIGTIPPAMAFSAARDPKAIGIIHKAHARILRALGFNVDFTPVLDLAFSNADNGLGTRCFSDDPRVVSAYAKQVVNAFLSEGVLCCGKHFPGLGDTDLDSHLDLPVVSRSWDQVVSEDLHPYLQLLPVLPFIMVNHALYPEKNASLPASLAPEIVSDFLLKQWNYQGLSISDDLIMGAVSKSFSLTESSKRALLAGNHLFLICKPEGIVDTFHELSAIAEKDEALQQSIYRAASRILSFKFHTLQKPFRRVNLIRDKKIIKTETRKLSEKALTLQQGRAPSRLPKRMTAYFPRTKWLKHDRSGFRAALSTTGCSVKEHYYEIGIAEADAVTLASQSQTEWNVVVTTSLHTRPGQNELVHGLISAGKRVIVINGFFPRDTQPLNAEMILATYWTSPAAMQAAAKAIARKLKLTGREPLRRK